MEHRDNPPGSGKIVGKAEPNSDESRLERNHLVKLRRWLMRHFDEEELRMLCFDLDVDYDTLGGKGKAGKVTELIAWFDRRDCIPELREAAEAARKQRSNVSGKDTPTETGGEPPTTQPSPPDQLSIEFVNRAYELDLICKPGAPRFVLVNGAAGYGKTYLLREVKETYEKEREGWKAASIDLTKDPQMTSEDCQLAWSCIANAVAQQWLSSQDETPAISVEASEAAVIGALVPYLVRQRANILLLFDNIEMLPPTTSAWLKRLVYDLDRGVKLARRELRVIFAGRYVGDWGEGTPYALSTLSLSPFNLVIVRTMVEQVVQTPSEPVEPDYLDDLAWWILHISGGHPRGICEVLQVVKAAGSIFPDLEFAFLHMQFTCNGRQDTLFRLCIEPIIDKLLQTVKSQLRAVLAAISPVRRFDQELLDTLLGQTAIAASGHCSSWELVRALLQTHLISPPTAGDPMFSDQIVRRMLAMQMQIQDPDRWRQINERALSIFQNWAIGSGPPDAQVRRTAIIESLYHALQLEPQDAPPDAVQERLMQRLDKYLAGIQNMRDILQLRNALGQDTELKDSINRQAGNQAFSALLNVVDRCLL